MLLLAGLAGLGVTWPGAGPAWAQPRAAAGREVPAQPAVVVDSQGRVVGPVIYLAGPTPVVRLRADGQDIEVRVYGDRLVAVSTLAQYELPDCAGAPWLPLTSAIFATRLFEPSAMGRLNEFLVANGDSVTRTVRSQWNPFRTPPDCDPIVPAEDNIVQPTRVILPGPFAPPFRLR